MNAPRSSRTKERFTGYHRIFGTCALHACIPRPMQQESLTLRVNHRKLCWPCSSARFFLSNPCFFPLVNLCFGAARASDSARGIPYEGLLISPSSRFSPSQSSPTCCSGNVVLVRTTQSEETRLWGRGSNVPSPLAIMQLIFSEFPQGKRAPVPTSQHSAYECFVPSHSQAKRVLRW